MKKFILSLIIVFQCFTFSSCGDEWSPMTCTASYDGTLKIEGKKGEKVSIQYIGPEKRKYKEEFSFNSSENNLPFFKEFGAFTVCKSKSFKKHNYNFLKIKNLGTEDIYICAILSGPEIEELFHYPDYRFLLRIYGKQDKDPNYNYKDDEEFKNTYFNYIDRYELYERLFKEGYPYIIKLPPQRTCIMKWGGLGFKVL